MRTILLALLLAFSAPLWADVTGPISPISGGSGSGCTLANPTATIGLTAVNGIATTCARSDSAAALDQSITPSWTGMHLWSMAEPRLRFVETDQGTDLKGWDLDFNAGVMCFRTRTDADGAGQNGLCITRGTTTTLTNETFGYSTSGTYTFPFTGAATHSGQVISNATGSGASSGFMESAASPSFAWNETDQTTDQKLWDGVAASGVLTFRSANDASSTFKNWLAITRSGNAITNEAFGNATDNPTYSFLGSGTATFNGQVTAVKSVTSGGTKPTVTGCSNTSTLGGVAAGSYLSGTSGTCTVTITLPTGPTNGYACFAHDDTTAADYTQSAIVTSVTTLTISGTTVSGDKIVWGCPLGY